MAWGQIIGAGIGAATSMMGQAAAKRRHAQSIAYQQWAAQRQFEIQEQQLNIQREQLNMAHAADNERRAENEYRRQQEIINRGIRRRERYEEERLIEEFKAEKMRDQEIAIQRQIQMDKAAARERQFELTEFLRNQAISAQERQTALDELEEVKGIVSGERDEDKVQFLRARAQKELEREFAAQEYIDAKGQAELERAESLARNQAIMAQIGRMEAGLNEAVQGLQVTPDIQTFSPADIQSEIDRRTSQYQADVDRAASAVASAGEADLIRTGMDLSTTGENRRAAIAARLAQDYQNARNRAYDDSMNFIKNQQGVSQADAGAIQDMRQQQLAEVAGIQGIGLDPMLRMTDARSALTAPAAYLNQLPTGVYDRRLSTASGYRAPIGIGSAIYDRTNMVGSGISPTANIPSAAVGMMPSSQVFDPYSMSIDDPSRYMGIAAGMGGPIMSSQAGVMRSADLMAGQTAAQAAGASKSFGSSMRGLSDELFATDWGDMFGGGGGGSDESSFMDNYQYLGPAQLGGSMDDVDNIAYSGGGYYTYN